MGNERKGFASMSPEKRREIARKGGKSSHSGFASMSSGKRREMARKGGHSSHGGGRKT